ncbi:hypothetical protein HYDPIDRAFT_93422 [Hydnomerulius pinastri MD-312]|uniref:Uncharacterized protein n=1 Tax=Hydnomerulius pinastri MD-312 TaxID=994086 RepID=A0A0C9W6X3_9AGAM|nr:hypothetical protein HYDPIDRAFT_93422 [Hydnomerulius pinastri MD-312]
MDDFDWPDELEALEDEEGCDAGCNCDGCRSANETDETENEESDGEDEGPQDPIQLAQTQGLKAKLRGQPILPKVRRVLNVIREEGMNLPLFLDALFWGGDPECHSDRTLGFARTALLVSEELPGILARCYRPPRNHNKGPRPAGGRRALEIFAVQIVGDLVNRDMEHLGPLFLSPPTDLTTEHLTTFDFDKFTSKIETAAPLVCNLVDKMVYSPKQRARNSHKNPKMVSCTR